MTRRHHGLEPGTDLSELTVGEVADIIDNQPTVNDWLSGVHKMLEDMVAEHDRDSANPVL